MTSQSIVLEFTEKLMEFLRVLLVDKPELLSMMETLFPPLIQIAVNDGVDAAKDVLNGLLTKNDSAAWDRIIAAASHEERINFLNSATTAMVAAKLKKIEAEKAQWEIFTKGLTSAFSILAVLLL